MKRRIRGVPDGYVTVQEMAKHLTDIEGWDADQRWAVAHSISALLIEKKIIDCHKIPTGQHGTWVVSRSEAPFILMWRRVIDHLNIKGHRAFEVARQLLETPPDETGFREFEISPSVTCRIRDTNATMGLLSQ